MKATRFLLVLQERETGEDAMGVWQTVFSRELRSPWSEGATDAIAQGLSLRNQLEEMDRAYQHMRKGEDYIRRTHENVKTADNSGG